MKTQSARLEELWDLVDQVPHGFVTNYGALGRAMRNPVSGKLVGNWMTQCPPDHPWWRVVAKSGNLPLSKRDPAQGLEQRMRLEDEGVTFTGDLVNIEQHYWQP